MARRLLGIKESMRYCYLVFLSALFAPLASGQGVPAPPPRPVIESVYPSSGSTAGGTYLVIDGSGFSFPREFNPWDAQQVYVGTRLCHTIPHYTTSTRIVCKTGPSTPWTTTDRLPVTVQLFYGLGLVRQAVATSAFRYEYWRTPAITHANWWAGTGGQVVQFEIEASSQWFNSSEYFDIYIGPNALCDVDQEEYPVEDTGTDVYVRCTLPDDDFLTPGYYNISFNVRSIDRADGNCPNAACFPTSSGDTNARIFGDGHVIVKPSGYERGRQRWKYGGTVDLRNGVSSHFTVYPSISKVMPSRSGVYGGNILTLEGSSFSPDAADNIVHVGGVPCEVLSATTTMLTCKLASAVGYLDDMMHPSGRGLFLKHYLYRNDLTHFAAAMGNLVPSESFVSRESQARMDYMGLTRWDDTTSADYYVRELDAYFIAPVTADYTFYIAGDDEVELLMSKGASFDDLQRIAFSHSYTTWLHHWQPKWYSNIGDVTTDPLTGPNTQVSYAISLVAGERYAFQLRHQEGSGGDHSQVAMKVSNISSATNAHGKGYSREALANMLGAYPAGEMQMLRFRMGDQTREKHLIKIRTNGNSQNILAIEDQESTRGIAYVSIPTGSTADEMRDLIRNARSSGSTVLSCTSITVDLSTSTGNGNQEFDDYEVTFNCDRSSSRERWFWAEWRGGGTNSVELIQLGADPITGSYTLTMDGKTTGAINIRNNRDQMGDAIVNGLRRAYSGANGIAAIEVEAYTWTYSTGNWDIWVRFLEPRGDLPLLTFDTSSISGENWKMEVFPIEDGDADAVFLQRIPVDLFQQPMPEARVPKVNLARGPEATVLTSGTDALVDGEFSQGESSDSYLCPLKSEFEIDLGREHDITEVIIGGAVRSNTWRSDDLIISVSSTSTFSSGDECASNVDASGRQKLRVPCVATGRYVQVKRVSSSMSVCEVEIFAGAAGLQCPTTGYRVYTDYHLGPYFMAAIGPVGVRGCREVCDANLQCNGYTVGDNNNTCLLYSDTLSGILTDGRADEDYTSFRKCDEMASCASTTVDSMECEGMNNMFDGFRYFPNPADWTGTYCDDGSCTCCRRRAWVDPRHVQVISGGVLGGTNQSQSPLFSFSYALTPVLLDVSPATVRAGTELRMVIQNLLSLDGVDVLIGGRHVCMDLTLVDDDYMFELDGTNNESIVRASLVNCTVMDGVAGTFQLEVISYEQGLANPDWAPTILYEPTIESMSQTSGSVAGGTLVTFTGDGLAGLKCSDIQVGGKSCEDPALIGFSSSPPNSSNSIACLTPAVFETPPAPIPTATVKDVTISEPASMSEVQRETFTYLESETAYISSVAPEEHSAALSRYIALTGTQFAITPPDTKPLMKFGSQFCEVDEVTFTDTYVRCWLQRFFPEPPSPPENAPLMWIPEAGFALVMDDVVLGSYFRITDLSIHQGSRGGGALVVLTGRGFHPWEPTKNEVSLKLDNGDMQTCKVMSGTFTEITCRLDAGDPYVTSTGAARRLAAASEEKKRTHEKMEEVCRPGATIPEAARPHCLARQLVKKGTLKRHSMAPVDHIHKAVHRLSYHPAEHHLKMLAAGEEVSRAEMERDDGDINPDSEGECDSEDMNCSTSANTSTVEDDEHEALQANDDGTFSSTKTTTDIGKEHEETEAIAIMARRLQESNDGLSEREIRKLAVYESVIDSDMTSEFASDITVESLISSDLLSPYDSIASMGMSSVLLEEEDPVDDDGADELAGGYIELYIGGIMAECLDETACRFNYSKNVTPVVEAVSPTNGSFSLNTMVYITLSNPYSVNTSSLENVSVFFGTVPCPVVASSSDWDDNGMEKTILTVELCEMAAGEVPVYVLLDPIGYALDASPYTGSMFTFEQNLLVDGVSANQSSFCGGMEVNIIGAGFDPMFKENNEVKVGWLDCIVTTVSYTELVCYTPPVFALDLETKLHVYHRNQNRRLGTGWRAEYWWFTSSTYPYDFLDLTYTGTPDAIRIEPVVAYNDKNEFDLGRTMDLVHGRWTATLEIDLPGTYEFYTISDDGSILYINGEEVVDNGGYHGRRTRSGTIYLATGSHFVLAQWFQGYGGANMFIQYAGPDTEDVVINIPVSVLSPASSTGGLGFLPEGALSFDFNYVTQSMSPTVTEFYKADDTNYMTVIGERFGNDEGSVRIGRAGLPTDNYECTLMSWSDTEVNCTLPNNIPGGEWSVRIWSAELGWSCDFWRPLVIVPTVTSVTINNKTTDVTSVADTFWTPILKTNGDSTWGFDDELWESDLLLNATLPFDEADNVKFPAYNTVPFRRIRMCVGSPDTNCFYYTFDSSWSNAKELFSAGELRATDLSQGRLLSVFGPARGSYNDCPMGEPGFNVVCSGNNKVRWGWCARCPNEVCVLESGGDADGVIGLGLRDQQNVQQGGGWTSYFASGENTCSRHYYVEKAVWVAVEDLGNYATVGSYEVGFGGGVEMTVTGSNLGEGTSQTHIHVCGSACTVTKSDGEEVTCILPPLVTQSFIDSYPLAFPNVEVARSEYVTRFFTDQGNVEASLAEDAYKSPIDESIELDSTRSVCWFAFELDESKRAVIDSVAFFPPTDPIRRDWARSTVFEVKNLTDTEWVEVATMEDAVVTGTTVSPGWNGLPLDHPISAQSFRVRILPTACRTHSYGRELMRGARFFGKVMSTTENGKCTVDLDSVRSPLASKPAQGFQVGVELVHTVERTPILAELTPRRGTARGDTLVTLLGSNLAPMTSSGDLLEGNDTDALAEVQVTFNGYQCYPNYITDTAVSCLTAERFAINPPSTVVSIGGRGYAIRAGVNEERTLFKYIDKWSNPFSWLDSEMPVDGDSVIVPEGQAILLDENSPLLFLVVVSGYMEFDRKDLMFNATYLWVVGGEFSVGTEQEPFLHQATITMHGDRWFTIELPTIGSKMLAVTNRGGLHGGCHVKTTNSGAASSPCEVDSVGKIDLHGRPDTSWTRLVETAYAGEVLLRLAEPVQWLNGSIIVITPTERGQTEERRVVWEVFDDGYTVEITEPLRYTHLGIWYHHEGIHPIDLRAAVGLVSKNVVVKGDDSSLLPGNSYLFGMHIGAFLGGEMRIENVEFTQTGQAANFGRYSSHWHVLAVGRNVDVLDKAYLRNNSYHDTFQRAVVVHSTDFAVVRDCVALRTHGHSFFTEVGDEDFTLFEHNLAINPVPHHLLLDDDNKPAGFWLPGFTGWHRSNMVANAHRGWRLRVLAGIATVASHLELFNNSIHASGHGWHLKPPHAARTIQNFRTFTAFRCGEGMFYYSTGRILHDDHRFVECGQGFHMNHLSNNVHTEPFFHDLIVVGNIDDESTSSRTGLALSGPKDNEYFFVSGATLINMHSSAAFRHCWETSCTVRYERVKWYNSTRYTVSTFGNSGIFHDLDGTLTGYPNGFVTWRCPFNEGFDECEVQAAHVGGLVCGTPDGMTRVRRHHIFGQEPQQLDDQDLIVHTEVGQGYVPFDWFKLYGWPLPVVNNKVYDIKIDHAIDFQELSLKYSEPPYVLQSWGFEPSDLIRREIYSDRAYTTYKPIDENIKVHLNYSHWRDHFDDQLNSPFGQRLDREPQFTDPYGSFSAKLWEDECAEYNLTNVSEAICNGSYHGFFGYDLYDELIQFPLLPRVTGRLTYVSNTKIININDTIFDWSEDTAWTLQQGFIARECPDEGCPTPPPPPATTRAPLAYRYWSDAAGWEALGKTLPVAFDPVELESGDWVVVDIDTPIVAWVTIQPGARLSFSREHNSSLSCMSILVWGELEMGSPEDPIPANASAEVKLFGEDNVATVIMVEGLFLTNKVVSVLGNLNAVGTPVVKEPWTRLASTAEAGSTTIYVQGDVSDWPVGATISIGATEFPSPPSTTETEDAIIKSVTYRTGQKDTRVVLESALSNKHFSGVVSPASDDGHYGSAIELRAHVALMTGRSNVRFSTIETTETFHGGYINIGGSSDGAWVGQCNISNVDFRHLGKFFYEQPAVKFNFLGMSGAGTASRPSSIMNSIFVDSKSGAISVDGATELELSGNVFHRTLETALWVRKTSADDSLVIKNNLALETTRSPFQSTNSIVPFAAFLLEVRPAVLTGNVAAGSTDSGFVLRPQLESCIAGPAPALPALAAREVNEAVGCVTGVFVLKGADEPTVCARVHGFRIWKSSHIGLTTVDQAASFRADTLVLSDNHIGMALSFWLGGAARNGFNHRVYGHNITIFGSTDASDDCSASTNCRAYGDSPGNGGTVGSGCFSVMGTGWRRVGMLAHSLNTIAQLCEANTRLPVCRPPNKPVKLCMMPWDKHIGTLPVRYQETHMSAITFGHFTPSDCSRQSGAFTINPTNKDFTFPYFWSDVKWLSSADEDARFIMDNYGKLDDSFVSPVIVDKDGTLLESGVAEGSVVPYVNPALGNGDCSSSGSFYSCPQLKLRALVYDPVGVVGERVLGSMKLWREEDGSAQWSNGAFKATCIPDDPPKRRGWAVKTTGSERGEYNATLFASSPKHQRFYYFNDVEEPIRVALHLSQPYRIEVYQDGRLLDETKFDTTQCCGTARYPTIDDPHGSYAFDPQQRRIYFTMRGGSFNGVPASRGGGSLFLRALQVVQLSLTLSVAERDFDGPSLIRNLATLLNIARGRIKIVQVQSRRQVARQGGRRLWVDDDNNVDGFEVLQENAESFHSEDDETQMDSGRRMTSNTTEASEIVIQIVEANPEPVPVAEMVDGLDDDALESFNITLPDEPVVDDDIIDVNASNITGNETTTTTTTALSDFSLDAQQDLLEIASLVQELVESGNVSEATGFEVEVDEVEVTSIDFIAGTQTLTTTPDLNATTNLTSSSSTSISTSSSTSSSTISTRPPTSSTTSTSTTTSSQSTLSVTDSTSSSTSTLGSRGTLTSTSTSESSTSTSTSTASTQGSLTSTSTSESSLSSSTSTSESPAASASTRTSTSTESTGASLTSTSTSESTSTSTGSSLSSKSTRGSLTSTSTSESSQSTSTSTGSSLSSKSTRGSLTSTSTSESSRSSPASASTSTTTSASSTSTSQAAAAAIQIQVVSGFLDIEVDNPELILNNASALAAFREGIADAFENVTVDMVTIIGITQTSRRLPADSILGEEAFVRRLLSVLQIEYEIAVPVTATQITAAQVTSAGGTLRDTFQAALNSVGIPVAVSNVNALTPTITLVSSYSTRSSASTSTSLTTSSQTSTSTSETTASSRASLTSSSTSMSSESTSTSTSSASTSTSSSLSSGSSRASLTSSSTSRSSESSRSSKTTRTTHSSTSTSPTSTTSLSSTSSSSSSSSSSSTSTIWDVVVAIGRLRLFATSEDANEIVSNLAAAIPAVEQGMADGLPGAFTTEMITVQTLILGNIRRLQDYVPAAARGSFSRHLTSADAVVEASYQVTVDIEGGPALFASTITSAVDSLRSSIEAELRDAGLDVFITSLEAPAPAIEVRGQRVVDPNPVSGGDDDSSGASGTVIALVVVAVVAVVVLVVALFILWQYRKRTYNFQGGDSSLDDPFIYEARYGGFHRVSPGGREEEEEDDDAPSPRGPRQDVVLDLQAEAGQV